MDEKLRFIAAWLSNAEPKSVLCARFGTSQTPWPAPSTIGDLLRRAGLVEPRRRPMARCDPLTVTDAESRFLIECRIVPPTTESVWPVVD